VESVQMFPIQYVGEAIKGQLRICRDRIHKIHDPTLRFATLESLKNLLHRFDLTDHPNMTSILSSLILLFRVNLDQEAKAGFCFGMDYVIVASPSSTT